MNRPSKLSEAEHQPAGAVPLRPGDKRRQRHQDRLGVAAGLQPEHGAAVIEQIEFDIAAAADELMAPLLFRPRKRHARPYDRGEHAEEGCADRADKREVAFPIAAVEIIEEDPADAARLTA